VNDKSTTQRPQPQDEAPNSGQGTDQGAQQAGAQDTPVGGALPRASSGLRRGIGRMLLVAAIRSCGNTCSGSLVTPKFTS